MNAGTPIAVAKLVTSRIHRWKLVFVSLVMGMLANSCAIFVCRSKKSRNELLVLFDIASTLYLLPWGCPEAIQLMSIVRSEGVGLIT